MVDRNVALEALGVLCNANVTSVQKQKSQAAPSLQSSTAGAAQQEQLFIKQLVSTVLDADEASQVSRSIFTCVKSILQGGEPCKVDWDGLEWIGSIWEEPPTDGSSATAKNHIIDEEEFFAPEFDYDFGSLKDTETYWRGGEKYERPCGWYRFGLKVLDKYGENTWLGTQYRSTQSVAGEWPVSYHGTSKKGAEGIIEGHYEAGPGQAYGRGIYSTPDISVAISYAKTFTSGTTGKTYKVILQNRINPEYRKKYNNDKYWLVPIPKGTSDEEEKKMVESAIRPYGLLLKEV